MTVGGAARYGVAVLLTSPVLLAHPAVGVERLGARALDTVLGCCLLGGAARR